MIKILISDSLLNLRGVAKRITRFVSNMDSDNDSQLSTIPNVEIDPSGDFKYILVEINDQNYMPPESKFVIRGTKRHEYHDDIYTEFKNSIKALDFQTKCLGGGRINHDAVKKSIIIYGYSVAFGKAKHKYAMSLLKHRFPEYDVTVQDD